jgi:hypothetical protein
MAIHLVQGRDALRGAGAQQRARGSCTHHRHHYRDIVLILLCRMFSMTPENGF